MLVDFISFLHRITSGSTASSVGHLPLTNEVELQVLLFHDNQSTHCDKALQAEALQSRK